MAVAGPRLPPGWVPAAETSSPGERSADSGLRALIASYRVGGAQAAQRLGPKLGIRVVGGAIQVMVSSDPERVTDGVTVDQVLDVGGSVVGSRGHITWLVCPLSGLAALLEDEGIVELSNLWTPADLVVEPVTDPLDLSDLVDWGLKESGLYECHQGGSRGAGARIAILDSGFAGHEASVEGGFLPAGTTVVTDVEGLPVEWDLSQHGTMVAEVAHRAAPDAEIFLLVVNNSEIELPAAVDWCIANGVDVINASWGRFNRSFYDGGGPISAEAKRAWENGIVWVSASGNSADGEHWHGIWQDADGDGLLEFSDGDEYNTFTLEEGDVARFFLVWDRWGIPPNMTDLDLCVEGVGYPLGDPTNTQPVGTCSAFTPLGKKPADVLKVPLDNTNHCELDPEAFLCIGDTFKLHVVRAGGIIERILPVPAGLKLSLHVTGMPGELAYSHPGRSIVDPAVQPDVITVGAAHAAGWEHGPIAPYSSFGPTNGDVQKPELIGPSGVWSSIFPKVAGTSFSAPYVAGAAAVLRARQPGLSPDEVKDLLTQGAVELHAPAPHVASGFGTLHLDCCALNCEAVACGDDGCGGSCGACEAGGYCIGGACLLQGLGCADGCDDDNACSVDICLENGACHHTAVSDGTACGGTGGWICESGLCTCTTTCGTKQCGADGCGGLCGTCDDGIACTFDKCDLESGACTQLASDLACDDELACTIDTCDVPSGGCLNVPSQAFCDDGIPCTSDWCSDELGCLSAPNDDACKDGQACTVDACVDGFGCVNSADDALCDDGVTCTADACDATAGCSNLIDVGSCDDGVECTIDACDLDAGGCQNAASLALCDDGIPCTADWCDSATGCIAVAEDAACTDAHECTVDSCLAGFGCVHTGDDAACDDGVPCTDGQCEPDAGCVVVPDHLVCADAHDCTSDTCVPGMGCASTADDAACDDGVACTVDSCDPASGCANDADPDACGDENPCTEDGCGPTGCTYAVVADGAACPSGGTCLDGACVACACAAPDCGDLVAGTCSSWSSGWWVADLELPETGPGAGSLYGDVTLQGGQVRAIYQSPKTGEQIYATRPLDGAGGWSGPWETEGIGGGKGKTLDGFAIDAGGHAHALFRDGVSELSYATNRAGLWELVAFEAGCGAWSSLVVDAERHAHALYFCKQPSPKEALRLTTNAAGDWQTLTLDDTHMWFGAVASVPFNSMASAPDGTLHLAYARLGKQNNLAYAHADPAVPELDISGALVDGAGDVVGGSNAIAVDAGGVPHIVYRFEGFTTTQLRYRSLGADGVWKGADAIDSVTSSEQTAHGLSLALGQGADPAVYVAYWRPASSMLVVAERHAGKWASSDVAPLEMGTNSSIFVDAGGQVHLFFMDHASSSFMVARNATCLSVADATDSNCDGVDGIDQDGDGFASLASGGADCDDGKPGAHPGAADAAADGVDTNCDGVDGVDGDGDGHASEGSGGLDCDDGSAAFHPGAYDALGDGQDRNCDGVDGIDADGDGYASALFGGADCDDGDASVHPLAPDPPGDGVDADCADGDGVDADGDGYQAASAGGGDCADGDPAVHPGAADAVDGFCPASSVGWGIDSILPMADPTSSSDRAIGLAYDAEGAAHICYHDAIEKDLRYATDATGIWASEVVDANDKASIHCSVAVDGSGVHIAYWGGMETGPRVASGSAGAFESVLVEPGPGTQLGRYGMLVAGDGGLHMAYGGGTKVRYASQGPEGWTAEPAGSTGGYHVALTLGAGGASHVAYTYHGWKKELRYATNATGGWATLALDTANAGWFPSMAVDADGHVHISYYAMGTETLRYATDSGGSWVTSTLDPTEGVGRYSSLVIDAEGAVQVAYEDDSVGALRLASNQSGEWSSSVVDTGGGRYGSLALNAEGELAVAYYGGGSLKLAVAAATCESPGDPADTNCDGVDGVDADADGVPSVDSGGTDCADQDATVHPGAAEQCDGKDNNCDGSIDEGC